jgi:hypothetical protein
MELKKLIDNHWEYVYGVLRHTGLSTEERERIEYHYKTAFEHGFKHGVESVDHENVVYSPRNRGAGKSLTDK